MKLKSKTDIIVGSAIIEEKSAEFSVTLEEANALRSALKTADQYKDAAFKALNKRGDDSDWCEVSYAVKNDVVIVNVRKGSIG